MESILADLRRQFIEGAGPVLDNLIREMQKPENEALRRRYEKQLPLIRSMVESLRKQTNAPLPVRGTADAPPVETTGQEKDARQPEAKRRRAKAVAPTGG